MLRLGLVGCGYWGRKLLRCAAATPGCAVTRVCDPNPEALAVARAVCVEASTTARLGDLLDDPRLDGVIVATPSSTHFRVAMAALRRNKHVLVEKPMASSAEEALRLIEEAEKRKRALLVDHTFLFSPAVEELRRMLAARDAGRIYYVDCVRATLGCFSSDVNVFWDVATHDLAILQRILGESPTAVSAVAGRGPPGCRESFGYLRLQFASGMLAHIHASWLWPEKTRRMTIAGDAGLIVYDDGKPRDKIAYFPAALGAVPAAVWNERFRGGRGLTSLAPEIATEEPLSRLLGHFCDCIQGVAKPLSDGVGALNVIRILEAADRSLASSGAIERLSDRALPTPASSTTVTYPSGHNAFVRT